MTSFAGCFREPYNMTEQSNLRLDNVTVHVSSVQETNENGTDSIEFFTAGSYYCKNGSHFIRYTEQGEGMKEIRTTVKIEGNERVTVMRHGSEAHQIVITKGERLHAFYHTEYGDLLLGVSGTKIHSEWSETGGSLHLEYLLDIDNAVASHNVLDISVRPPQS